MSDTSLDNLLTLVTNPDLVKKNIIQLQDSLKTFKEAKEAAIEAARKVEELNKDIPAKLKELKDREDSIALQVQVLEKNQADHKASLEAHAQDKASLDEAKKAHQAEVVTKKQHLDSLKKAHEDFTSKALSNVEIKHAQLSKLEANLQDRETKLLVREKQVAEALEEVHNFTKRVSKVKV